MSERNTLRYGALAEVQAILEERPPRDMDEVRSVLMNVIDVVRAFQSEHEKLSDRVAEIAPRIN